MAKMHSSWQFCVSTARGDAYTRHDEVEEPGDLLRGEW